MTLRGQALGGNVVCEQREWDAMELARPGYHLLVREGIKTEQEAEKLARGTAGDPPVRRSGAKAIAAPVGALLPVVPLTQPFEQVEPPTLEPGAA
jgi:hypothetical protein